MTRTLILIVLLSFTGGFIDTAGLLGLHGMFIAHVTGNLVILAMDWVLARPHVLSKALALPEYVATIALTRTAARLLAARGDFRPHLMFALQVGLLFGFFLAGVLLGPFRGGTQTAFLVTAGLGVAAAAMQNALLATYLPQLPPTTFMSGNSLRAALDATDLMLGKAEPGLAAKLRSGLTAIAGFALGCCLSALLFHKLGFWSLLLPVLVGGTAGTMAARAHLKMRNGETNSLTQRN